MVGIAAFREGDHLQVGRLRYSPYPKILGRGRLRQTGRLRDHGQSRGQGRNDQAAAVVRQIMRRERPALIIHGRIEPVRLAVASDHGDAVVKGAGRRPPVPDRAPRGGVHQHRIGLHSQRAQNRDEQQRLVLAIAEAPREDHRWVGGFFRAVPDFNSEITHLVLNKPQDGQNLLLRAGNLLPFFNLPGQAGREG